MTTSSVSKLHRSGRWLGMAAVVASLAILVFACVQRGYRPRLRIAKQNVTALAFSPQGDVLAVATNGGTPNAPVVGEIRFLSAIDGREVQPALPAPEFPSPVLSGEYSRDGKRLAVLRQPASGHALLEVFDLTSRAPIAEQKITYSGQTGSGGPEGQVTFRFSPDSNFIAWSGNVVHDFKWSRVVGVLDLTTGKERFSLEKTGAPEISPDSRRVATTSDHPQQELKLWDAHAGELERSMGMVQGGYFRSPVFSSDGNFVAFSGNGSKTEVFDTADGKRVFENPGWSAQFLAEGNTLMMVAGFDVQFWDTTTWKLKGSHKFGNLGRSFWTGDPITPHAVAVPNRPQVAVLSIHAGYYGSLLRWIGRNGQLNTWGTGQLTLIDAKTGARQKIELHETHLVATAQTPYGHATVFSPKGDSMALTMLFTNDVILWDLPPRPSYVAPTFAAAIACATIGLLLAFRRKKKEN